MKLSFKAQRVESVTPSKGLPSKVTTSQREVKVKVSCQLKFHLERICVISLTPTPTIENYTFFLLAVFN